MSGNHESCDMMRASYDLLMQGFFCHESSPAAPWPNPCTLDLLSKTLSRCALVSARGAGGLSRFKGLGFQVWGVQGRQEQVFSRNY